MKQHVWAAGLVALAACGPVRDPIAPLRANYADQLRAPASDLPAHAIVRVGDGVLDSVVLSLASVDAIASPPGPMGLRAVILPTVELADVRANSADDPTGAPHHERSLATEVELSGKIRVDAGFVDFRDSIRVEVRSTIDLAVAGAARGSELVVGWDPEGRPTVALDAASLPPAIRDLVAVGLEQLVAGFLEPAIHLPLPGTRQLFVRDVRTHARDDVWLDVALSGVDGVAATPPDTSPDEIQVSVRPETVLGLLRAEAAGQPIEEPYLVEPVALSIAEDGLFTVDARVHRRSRGEPRYRTYRVTGRLGVAGDQLEFPVESFEFVEEQGWKRGLKVRIGEARATSIIERILDGTPSFASAKLGDRTLRVSLRTFTVEPDGSLVAHGAITVD